MDDLFEYLLAMQKGTGGGGGEKAQLQTPYITTTRAGLPKSSFDISDTDTHTKSYEIYVDGELVGEVARVPQTQATDLTNTIWEFNETVDLFNYGAASISFVAEAESGDVGFNTLNIFSQIMSYEKMFAYGELKKGDKIQIGSLLARVLKVDGNIAEVLLMQALGVSIPFSSTSSMYAGSDLDIYLNQTTYDSIIESGVPAEAILDTAIHQDVWRTDNAGNPSYDCSYIYEGDVTQYSISFDRVGTGSIVRKIYAPSLQDIIDYVTDLAITDGSVSFYNLWKTFWGVVETQYEGVWLRDVLYGDNSKAWGVNGIIGSLETADVTETTPSCWGVMRLDLTKIEFYASGTTSLVNPIKGMTIDDGTGTLYKVLKTEGRVADVLMLSAPLGIDIPFGETSTYEGSTLDYMFNEVLYDNFPEQGKFALIDKDITQDSWYIEAQNPSGSPVYQANAERGGEPYSYILSLDSAEYGNEITRHIYAPSVQDILDYLGATPEMSQSDTTITAQNVANVLNGYTSQIWLRSNNASSDNEAFTLAVEVTALTTYKGALLPLSAEDFTGVLCYPMFRVDTSKLYWACDSFIRPF